MKEIRKNSFAAVILTLLLLAGCGVAGLGGVTGGGQTGGARDDELQGTINRIDRQDQYLVMTQTNGNTSNLVNRDDSIRIYYDDRTPVTYEGETYRPADLEIGDQISVFVRRSGDQIYASSMRVLYDVSGDAGAPSNPRTTQVQGMVRDIDTRQQTIEIDQSGSLRSVTILYDAKTYVEQNDRRFHPETLRRGDQVDVSIRETARGELLADSIYVVRNTVGDRDRNTISVVRGTIRGVNPNQQMISLEQTRQGLGFNSGVDDLLRLYYDANTIVEYQGDRYSPTRLERGDVVDIEVQDIGRRQVAQRIMVVRDARTLR
jgi:hypothetical protein